MITLDKIIGQMKTQQCSHCILKVATADRDEQGVKAGDKVHIYGSFCGHDQILIKVRNEQNELVWSEECDRGRTSTIPFTSPQEFACEIIRTLY